MAMNRIQFQSGLSIHEFIDRFGTVAKCEQTLIEWRWPQGYESRHSNG